MDDLSKKIVKITKKIRTAAYEVGKSTNVLDEVPFGGSIRESIGPFPEFILKGRFCKRSLCGLCSPCFYSRLPVHTLTDEQFDEGYSIQVKHIASHFFEKVKANQAGTVAYKFKTNKPVYGMVCTPTGSYFDEKEYPVKIRIDNLNTLLSMADLYECELVLHIESHAEDVIEYFSKPNTVEIDLLHKLHTRVLLGFESADTFSRNTIYSKNLDLSTFEDAVKILKANGFPVGAFVFAGLITMTEREIIKDVSSSFEYLKKIDVSPVLMCANIQEYTIPDVLYEVGKYKLLDPRTVYKLIQKMVSVFGTCMDADIDPWFIADPVGGPPDPNIHLFNSQTNTACPTCSKKIYEAIEKLRITKDAKSFEKSINEVEKCDCISKYEQLVSCQEKEESIDISERVRDAVIFAENESQYYVLRKNPWVVKAELLCYGLYITENQKKELYKHNPYIYEKGFINATHIKYRDTLINVCVSDSFCQQSPYSLKQEGEVWFLQKDKVSIGIIEFLAFPAWVTKTKAMSTVGAIVRPHSDKCLSIWPSTDCYYVNNNNGCKYCSLTTAYNKKRVISPSGIALLLEDAFSFNPEYELNLSGGTCASTDSTVRYFCNISMEVTKRFGKVPISAEFAPPDNMDLLESLKESGVTAAVINLEIYDDSLRKIICPGKSSISRDKYFESLKRAVEVFGKGNVSSVLIVGIQPVDDIIIAINRLVEIGVIPTLIPIKPLDGTEMEGHSLANPKEYIYLSRYASNLMVENNISIRDKTGCAACGACSLEIDL